MARYQAGEAAVFDDLYAALALARGIRING